MIEPEILPDHESMSRRAADWLVERIRQRPDSLISLAAGSTPKRTYELLAAHGESERATFLSCRFIKLDEWGGLTMDDAATCEHQLQSLLIEPLDAARRYTAFQSDSLNPAAECDRIAGWLLENGPIDVAVLGLGINGHVGFNEPASYLQPHAHVAELSTASMGHEMLLKSNGLPTYGVTLGMADLLQANEILLIAGGSTKRGPVERLLSGQLTTAFPASLLHLHPRVTMFCDENAMPTI